MSAKRNRLSFTPAQNRLITSTIALLCGATLAAAAIVSVLAAMKAMAYFVHIVGPVLVAYFLSLLTRPWYARLKAWLGGREVWAVILFTLSLSIPIAALCWFFGAFIVSQSTNLAHALPQIVAQLRTLLSEAFPDSRELVHNILPNLTGALSSDGALSLSKVLALFTHGAHVGGAVFSAGSAFLLWLLTFFYWIIFVMQKPLSGEAFARRLPFIGDAGRAAVAFHFRAFNDIIVSYFRGQIIDVSIQGVLYGTAFQLLGLPNGFIIGFVLGLLNLMPYLGVMSGLCVALPVAYFHAGFGYTCIIFAVFCCIQTFDGYIMQPYIQGNRMKLSAWQIVFALLFWTQLGGFLGLLLAIPITAFIKASWEGLRGFTERFAASAGQTGPAVPAPTVKESRP